MSIRHDVLARLCFPCRPLQLRYYMPPSPLAAAANSLAHLRPALAAAALALALAGCKADSSEPPPESGADYYPVAVNNFWIYAVADSTWMQATPTQPSTVQVSNYQFRETVSGTFQDAAGQTAYRLVRARRVPPATAWLDDSVFTLRATSHFVQLTRNNLRTLELVFPIRQDSLWNANAFNDNTNDPISARTRQYRRVGQALTVAAAGAPQTYANTVSTTNEGTAKRDDLYEVKTYRQVYAKGVGPVQRQRRRLIRYYLNSGPNGNPVFYPGSYFFGFSRLETLVDYGPR